MRPPDANRPALAKGLASRNAWQGVGIRPDDTTPTALVPVALVQVALLGGAT